MVAHQERVCPHCKQVINPGERVHYWEGVLWHTKPCPGENASPTSGTYSFGTP